MSAATTTSAALAPLTYTVPQLRTVANIGRTKAYELIAEGKLRAMKAGSKTLVDAESVRSFLAGLPTFPAKAA